MHAHVTGLGGQVFNPYANAAALERTSAQQEAAATRRRLLQEAAQLGGDASADTVELAGQWKAGQETAGGNATGDAGVNSHDSEGKQASETPVGAATKSSVSFYAGLGKPVAVAEEAIAVGRISIRV